MVRIGTPFDIYNYIRLSNDRDIQTLAVHKFMPIWKDNDFVYFRKSRELIKFMEKEEIVCQN